METIDILRKEFSEIISLVGYGGLLVGLYATINKPTFAKELSTEKLKVYITLAGYNVNQDESSIRQFLESLDPEEYRIYASGLIYDIYKVFESRGLDLVKELVERSVL